MANDLLTSAFLKIGDRLRNFAKMNSGNDASVDDTLQEAFLRLWRKRETIQSESHAEGLLVSTVRNLTIDSFRTKKDCIGLTEIHSGCIEENDDNVSEAIEEIYGLMARSLSERERLILLQRDRDEWDFESIARYHGLLESNVRVILSRARRTLRDNFNRKH